jgi:hypothetical protein
MCKFSFRKFIRYIKCIIWVSYGFDRDEKEKYGQEWKLLKRENEILKELKANEASEDEAMCRLKSFKESCKNNKNIF